ncbi:uncharacterized protein PHA67_021428 isoform 1-T1 [Liasis olivaceus]
MGQAFSGHEVQPYHLSVLHMCRLELTQFSAMGMLSAEFQELKTTSKVSQIPNEAEDKPDLVQPFPIGDIEATTSEIPSPGEISSNIRAYVGLASPLSKRQRKRRTSNHHVKISESCSNISDGGQIVKFSFHAQSSMPPPFCSLGPPWL